MQGHKLTICKVHIGLMYVKRFVLCESKQEVVEEGNLVGNQVTQV